MKTQIRLLWLDNLKGLTIILVVLGHCLTDIENKQYLKTVLQFIYVFHMPLFFMISGISFNLAESKAKRISIIKNIICIYIIQSVIYICMNCIIRQYLPLNSEVSWDSILYLVIKPVAHFWYLHSLIIFYFVCTYIRKYKKIILVLALFLVFVSKIVSIEYLSKVLFMFFFFYVGTIRIDKLLNSIQKIIYVICCLSWCLLSFKIGTTYFILVFGGGIIFSVTLIYIFKYKLHYNFRALEILGKNCIWIYIFHSYFTSFSRALCLKFGVSIVEIKILICTLLGILGPLIIKKSLEKIKLEKIVTKPIELIK